ncbi:glycosyltransferase [Vibrio sp. 10N.286.49.C2]|uniref:glycosyltransferase n=1 Tax=unclassified Vibrio TaxID=2614977 RepID=UPI000C83F032|nr:MULTISPECIES: glycosyltransferase [unclassified Vibrio]PMH34501.1 glycosyltransferase [Vibrio sp. 10N.286.49.C2]PMH46986.1 glycosyltransferase [Vibrio sp. 10N.286.49.B1]
MTPSIEVIIATYNNVTDSELVLEGYARQTCKAFSICVADDGSGPEIAELVQSYRKKGLTIRHIWQEDCGFRRAMILNKAIKSSNADYLIFTDNDCIPSRHFINDYQQRLSLDSLIFGRRVDLFNGISQQLRQKKLSIDNLDRSLWLLTMALFKKLKRVEVGLRLPNWELKLVNKRQRSALGANMGIPRQALIAVNGFDNDFVGYGMEESDIERRLTLHGYQAQSIIGRCCLFHLYHAEKTPHQTALDLYYTKKQSGNTTCRNGIEHNE